MQSDDIILRHCRILQNYFRHNDLTRMLDSAGYTRFTAKSIFVKATPKKVKTQINANVETLYDYISKSPATTVERFKRVIAVAKAYHCRDVKYLSSDNFFQVLHLNAGIRNAIFKNINTYIVEDTLTYFKAHQIKYLIYTSDRTSTITTNAMSDEIALKASNEDINRLMRIYKNSQPTLDRLNYVVDKLPLKWHIPQTTDMMAMKNARQLNRHSDDIMQKLLSQTLIIDDLQGLYKLHIDAIAKHFVNIMRIQVTEFYIFDQVTKFNDDTKALSLFTKDNQFDNVNSSVSQLQVLISLADKYDMSTKFVYLTPELINILAPLCTVEIRKMINEDIDKNTKKFRRGTKGHVQTIQQIVSNYKSNQRKYYFMSFETIRKVFQDFRLYDRYYAKYTNEYINQQSDAWRKAFGNIEATTKIEMKQKVRLENATI